MQGILCDLFLVIGTCYGVQAISSRSDMKWDRDNYLGYSSHNYEHHDHGNKNTTVNKVHLIFMNHLDVGYSDIPGGAFIANVLNTYFHTYFPRAASVAAMLEKDGYVENMVYTTHPWLVSFFMDCPKNMWLVGKQVKCPNASEVATFTDAVHKGYISWHAGPMNMQTDNMNDYMMEFGIQLSKDLDKAFNITRNFRTLSQRDVPGMTRAAIPSLVKMGVHAVSVGVNDRVPPPKVPPVFRWRYGKDEIMATFHPGGYPEGPGPNPARPIGLSRKDCLVVDGFDEALCFAFRTDNTGPPDSVQEVLGYFEILRAEFPGAKLIGSTFEKYFEALGGFADHLPVITNEITDSWIQGIASDPRKAAEYRVISRHIKACLDSGSCSLSESPVYNASRFLVKIPEHTYGLSGVSDTINWDNKNFQKVLQQKNFQAEVTSWLGQRNFTNLAVEALGNHSIVPAIQKELNLLKADYPFLDNFYQVESPTEKPFSCGNFLKMGFSMKGSLTTLTFDGVSWANASHPLAEFVYSTYNQADIDYCSKKYFYQIGFTGFLKPNVTKNAFPESRSWSVTLKELYTSTVDLCDFYAHIEMVEPRSMEWYGAPQEVWIRYTYTSRPDIGAGIDVEFQMFQKPATRLPEALFLAFTPLPQTNHQWVLSKMGRAIDPHNILQNGNQYQQGVDDEGVAYINTTSGQGLRLGSLDVPLVIPSTDGILRPYPAPLDPITDPITNMAYNIYNNMWNTNYIYWYPFLREDANFKARFRIEFMTKGSKSSKAWMQKWQQRSN